MGSPNALIAVPMRLQATGAEYLDFDEVETADMKWASAKKAGQPSAKGSNKSDGALLLLAEARPFARIRVARAEMEEGVVVKEMSEAAVLARLEKGLKELEKATGRS